MLEITHKQKMLKLHNLNSNYGITKILQIANAKKIVYKKQTPTTVNTKKFYTKSKIVKQEHLSIFCNYCLKIV